MRGVMRTLEEQIEVTARSLEAMERLVVHLRRVTDLLQEAGAAAVTRSETDSTSRWSCVDIVSSTTYSSTIYIRARDPIVASYTSWVNLKWHIHRAERATGSSTSSSILPQSPRKARD
ncbi:uncharacterized protein KRP23_4675 [Phytophthora ramorum]|uniref:uncharacterized protein n=1 Tax=Phytophthora ramorum TaxID=164328 RepID=UPI0030B05D62|nr:hypothetical protein KRP23_4675 [Phytophthora ramorum]